MKTYTFHRCKTPPSLDLSAGAAPRGWEKAEIGQIENFRKEGAGYRPPATFRGLVDDHYLYVRFDVLDRHAKIAFSKLNSPVCQDSCVEFFVKPEKTAGYVNFEVNAKGTLLLSYITNPRRLPDGSIEHAEIDPRWAKQVVISSSIPRTSKKYIEGPLAWSVAYRIPLALLAAYTGRCSAAPGSEWRANFYKCEGDEHFGSWSPIGKPLDFHCPDHFGKLLFD